MPERDSTAARAAGTATGLHGIEPGETGKSAHEEIDQIAADAAGAAARRVPRSTVRLVLLGPPGSGKGTQAEILAARLGVPAISTGGMLREAVAAGTDLGRRVHGIMTAGELVDDATMAEVVRERLRQPDTGRGFLLDGYPRTPGQARTLEAILGERRQRLDGVLLIDAPEEELIHRIAGRGREDDGEAVAQERLRVYREKTRPLVGYYEGQGLLRTIDGDQPVDHVTADVLAALGEAV